MVHRLTTETQRKLKTCSTPDTAEDELGLGLRRRGARSRGLAPRASIGVRGVADSQSGDGLHALGNLEDFAGFIGKDADHLVNGQPADRRLNGQDRRRQTQIVDGGSVRLAVQLEEQAGAAQGQNRDGLRPDLVALVMQFASTVASELGTQLEQEDEIDCLVKGLAFFMGYVEAEAYTFHGR